jgi:3,4-dihydroxy-2-butanone 4-phosphate synthase
MAMTKSELKKLAIKHLNSKNVKSIKKQLFEQFIDRKQKKECITAFDKNFINSFISSRQNPM